MTVQAETTRELREAEHRIRLLESFVEKIEARRNEVGACAGRRHRVVGIENHELSSM